VEVGDAAAWAAAAVAGGAAFIALIAANYSRRQAAAAEGQVAAAKEQADTAREQLAFMRADREDRERQEQRDAVLELLRTGRAYASALDGLIMFMGVIADYVEVTQSDSWGSFERAREPYEKARLHAQYAVTASEIIDVIHRLETVGSMLTERTTKLVLSERDARGHAPVKDIAKASAIPKVLNQLLDRLEELANQHYRRPGDAA
jgi:hypothetical protein